MKQEKFKLSPDQVASATRSGPRIFGGLVPHVTGVTEQDKFFDYASQYGSENCAKFWPVFQEHSSAVRTREDS